MSEVFSTGKARPAECECSDRYTCGACLSNAKPWHYTGESGTVYPRAPVDLDPTRTRRVQENP